MQYFDRYQEASNRLKTRIVVGIDPHLDLLPQFLKDQLSLLSLESYLERFCAAHIDAAKGKVPAVKFQSAFFEACGLAGLKALKHSLHKAKNAGLLTILDAKRGDISSTMTAYGKAAFEELGGDCLTVAPYMGVDVVDALLPWLSKGKAVYVVWVTSNLTARHPQSLRIESDRQSRTVSDDLLEKFEDWQAKKNLRGAVGYVCGATRIDEQNPEIARMLPNLHLLVPGFGAQGAIKTGAVDNLLAKSSGTVAVPVSRGISGIGCPQRSDLPIKTWEGYAEYITAKLDETEKNLKLAL